LKLANNVNLIGHILVLVVFFPFFDILVINVNWQYQKE